MDVDDTLVLILERIDSAVSLIRAASTCRRWRRVIADAGFLRRHRSLHGPLVAGDYHTAAGYDPKSSSRFVPASSSSSIVDASYFSLDFLVDKNIFPGARLFHKARRPWDILDSRGSLLLMECIHETHIPGGVFPNLVVCEPVTQHYKIIPKSPDFDGANYYVKLRGPYLVDGDEDAAGGSIGMSNFGVLCVLFSHNDHVARTTVFTVRANATELTWSEKAIDNIASRLRFRVTTRFLGNVLGSHYFYVEEDGMLITYNGGTGKFLSSVLSRDIKSSWDHYVWIDAFSVVDGGDGEPRIVAMMDHTMEVFGRVDGEWTSENKILLSKVTCNLPGYPLSFPNGCLMLIRKGVGFVVMYWWDLEQHWHFSIDPKTMEAAPVEDGSMEDMVYRCEFPWPPVLQACLD